MPPPESAPPPRQPSTSPTVLAQHSFPSEILVMILNNAVPPVPSTGEHHLKEDIIRQMTLARLALVSKSWAREAQKLLYRRVRLPLPTTAHKTFVVSRSSPHGEALTNETKWLKIGKEDTATNEEHQFLNPAFKYMILRTVMTFPSLTELWLESPCPFDPTVLSWAVNLKTLALEDVVLQAARVPPGEDEYTWHFPHLTTLSLDAVRFLDQKNTHRHTALLLNRKAFPRLENLFLFYDAADTQPDFSLLGDSGLEALYIRRRFLDGSPGAPTPPPPLPTCLPYIGTDLLHLSCDIYNPADIVAIHTTPTLLQTLALDTPAITEVEREILKPVDIEQSSVTHLSHLYLPADPLDEEQREESIRKWSEAGVTVLTHVPALGPLANSNSAFRWLSSLPPAE
ncbi:hypothetical protein MNV49_004762 [Pseudohyphozyma bogoriensis]|nr:hypothetical protein MNV49_004762 [Pseudohyphozyma bogoriensis]